MDKTTENKIIELYMENILPISEILRITGFSSDQTIYNVLERNGVEYRRNTLPNTLPDDEIVAKYLSEGMPTAKELAQVYDCHRDTICKILRDKIGAERVWEERRKRLSAWAKKRAQTPEGKAHLRKMRKNSPSIGQGWVSEEVMWEAVRKAAEARTGTSLSEEHMQKLREPRPNQRGENSPAWKGGVSAYQWRKPNWRRQRKKARNRDENTCQICGTTASEQGQNMDVHHIESYHSFDNPKEANKLPNLICLCRTCHLRVENGILECPQL